MGGHCQIMFDSINQICQFESMSTVSCRLFSLMKHSGKAAVDAKMLI